MCEGIWEDGRSSLQGALIKGKEPQPIWGLETEGLCQLPRNS